MKESDLAEIKVDIKWIKEQLSNHLKHHERYETTLIIGILLMILEQLVTQLIGK
jgi:hypothetical protein